MSISVSSFKNKSWNKFRDKNKFFASQMSFDSGFDAGATFSKNLTEKEIEKIKQLNEKYREALDYILNSGKRREYLLEYARQALEIKSE